MWAFTPSDPNFSFMQSFGAETRSFNRLIVYVRRRIQELAADLAGAEARYVCAACAMVGDMSQCLIGACA
jgi:hypothetical protein